MTNHYKLLDEWAIELGLSTDHIDNIHDLLDELQRHVSDLQDDKVQADWCEANEATVQPTDHYGMKWEVSRPTHKLSWFGRTRRKAIDTAMEEEYNNNFVKIICVDCNGAGVIKKENAFDGCSSCDGVGFKMLDRREAIDEAMDDELLSQAS